MEFNAKDVTRRADEIGAVLATFSNIEPDALTATAMRVLADVADNVEAYAAMSQEERIVAGEALAAKYLPAIAA